MTLKCERCGNLLYEEDRKVSICDTESGATKVGPTRIYCYPCGEPQLQERHNKAVDLFIRILQETKPEGKKE